MVTAPAILLCVFASQHQTAGFKELYCRDEVASLQARLHKKITVKRELAAHFLCVRANTQDAERELTAVAAALRATIVSTSDGLVIGRDAKQMEAARKQWADARTVWIQQKIDDVMKFGAAHEADKDPIGALKAGIELALRGNERVSKGDVSAYGDLGLKELSPAGRLTIKVLDRLGSHSLAILRINKATIFESRPIGAALPLPQCEDLLQEYTASIEELRLYKLPPNLPPFVLPALIGIGSDFSAPADIRVTVHPQRNYLAIVSEVFDAQGNLVGQSFLNPAAYAGPAVGDGIIVAQNKPIRESDDVAIPDEILERSRVAHGQSATNPPPWFLHPIKIEPLSLDAGFGIESLAAADPSPCIVSDLNDELFSHSRDCVHGDKFNVKAFRAVLDQWDPYERVQGNGFSVWRPNYPDDPEPMDRVALERLVGDSLSSGYIDSRQLAVLIQGGSPLFSFWNPELYKRLPEMHSPDMRLPQSLRLLGAISDADWRLLLTGRSQTGAQLGIVDNLTQFFNEATAIPALSKLPDLYRHTAELFRGVDFGDTPIRITHTEEGVYRIYDQKQKRMGNWAPQAGGVYELTTTARLVGGVATLDETRDQFEARMDGQYSFQTGTRSRQQFIIGLPRGLQATYDLPFPVTNLTDEPRYSDLPVRLSDITWKYASDAALARARSGGG